MTRGRSHWMALLGVGLVCTAISFAVFSVTVLQEPCEASADLDTDQATQGCLEECDCSAERQDLQVYIAQLKAQFASTAGLRCKPQPACPQAAAIAEPSLWPDQHVMESRRYRDFHALPSAATLMLTFAAPATPSGAQITGQAADIGSETAMTLNWVRHVCMLGLPHAVVVPDEQTRQLYEKYEVPVYTPKGLPMPGAGLTLGADAELELDSLKPRVLLQLLDKHNFDAVAVSDPCTVWLRDMQSYMDMHPVADMFMASDCLSHQAEALATPNVDRCGHVPGSESGMALNEGIIILRNRVATKALLRQWAGESAPSQDPEGRRLQDPPAGGAPQELALLLEAGSFPVAATAEDPQLIWAAQRSVRLGVLPALLAASGHTHFVQRLADRYQVQPYAVHASSPQDGRAHTPLRLREAGLWAMDNATSASVGNFLTFTINVEAVLERHTAQLPGAGPSDLQKHLLAVAYQAAVLQEAAGLARALNRTLVLPHFQCYCDQAPTLTVLQACTVPGSDLRLPFTCPADRLLNAEALEAAGIPYRAAGFLERSQVPANITRSRMAVHIQPAGQPPPATVTMGLAASLQKGATDRQAQAALRKFAGIRVLDVVGLEPSSFGGFEDMQTAAAFRQQFQAVVAGTEWCCFGEWMPNGRAAD
ncbi:hypothetical protein WJX72_006874 [[Myrmecia] bisecta]|uniref:Nucleotide-diphospho-sugar transferase domain-containing protein n=1 Tax=[Myrmecia] bisecta TaxID=41462 RepID=A0AAW1P8Y5_9CHLO